MNTTTVVHVFVEINRHEQKKLEFDHVDVTGTEIKQRAGVSPNDDIALRVGQKLEPIANEQHITLKNGEHFVVVPAGTVS